MGTNDTTVPGPPRDDDIARIFEAAAQALMIDEGTVARGRIFHSVGVQTDGHFFAFVRRGEVVMKLPADRVTGLLTAGTGTVFDAGRGRPMREWICLHPEDSDECHAFLTEALAFAHSRRETRTTSSRRRGAAIDP